MLTNLSYLTGNWTGTHEALAPETTLDGEPVGSELPPDPEASTAPQGAAAPVSGGQPPKSFHEWKDPTGKTHRFASADELSNAMTQSFFLQSDYSKKTDVLKGREGQLTAREKALNEQAKKLKELEGKYGSFRNFMSQRPELFQQFSQMLNQPQSPGEAVSAAKDAVNPLIEELKNEISSLKERLDGADYDRKRSSIHERLASEFDDYNAEAIDNFMASVDEKNPEALFRFAYHALRGQKDPILAQKRAAEQDEANRKHRGVLPGGRVAPPPRAPKTLEEGRNQALADLT